MADNESGGPKVSVRAQAKAEELGVDLSKVQPTGDQGRVSLVDVERTHAQQSSD